MHVFVLAIMYINVKRACTVDVSMGDLDYLKWIGLYASKKKPLFSEFQSYTKFSGNNNPLEDYTTFCLAICIESDPKPFEDFLKEIYDGFDEEIILVWPQCKIDKNRLDLLIGLKNGSDEINSCLIIEAKVEDPLKKWQLEQYIGKGSCKYLALTKYNEDEVEVKNWTKSTWQDLANFIYLRKYSSKLWNELINSMASNGIVSDLSGVPNMEISNFSELINTAKTIMDSALTHYYDEKTKGNLDPLGFYYYNKGKSAHRQHIWNNQLKRCNRFTIACDDGKDDDCWYLFGLFPWKDSQGNESWFAGGVIETKPEKNPSLLKQKLVKAGLENKDWKLFDSAESADTTFDKHLVAMKAKNMDEFKDKTISDVVEYIKQVIDEVGKAPHVKSGSNLVYG